jgi:hypothetical protein
MTLWNHGPRDAPYSSPYSEVYYFVGSAALDRLYPAAASPGTIQSSLISESAGSFHRDIRGGKSEIKWHKIVTEAALLMARHKYRTLTDLQNAICEHFPEELSDVDGRTLQRYLTDLHKGLKVILGD